MSEPAVPEKRIGRVRPLAGRGRVLPLAEGRVGRVRSLRGSSGVGLEVRRRSSLNLLMLAASLPFFCQIFHYLIDTGPFYYLSKAWPVLMFPLAYRGISTLRSDHRGLYAATIAYVAAVTPVLSMLWLGNSLIDAWLTTVKIWPLTYYFGVLALLTMVLPASEDLDRILWSLGLATLAALWLLWIVAPAGWYASDAGESKLFMYELERGYRIYLPLTFAVIAIFRVAHRLTQSPRLWHVVFLAAAFGSIILINKQRLSIVSAAVVTILIIAGKLPRVWRTLAVGAGTVLAVAALAAALGHVDQILKTLGNSLAIRQHSLEMLRQYVQADPLRWLFGVGGTTRFGSVTLFEILNQRDFYLADLGWPGVIFEYGLVGSALLLALYIAVLRRRPAAREAPADTREAALIGALSSYVLYLLLTTTVYSAVFAPGELATVTALLVYLRRQWHPLDTLLKR